MTDLVSHLVLGSGCADCGVELVSNCRTRNNLLSSPSPCKASWRVADCDDCCCADVDPGNDDVTSSPWWDQLIPASSEYLGLWGRLTLGPAGAGDLAATAAPPQYLTFSGAIIATSERGAQFGEAWIRSQLTPDCVVCDGQTATYQLFCGPVQFSLTVDVK